MQFTFNLPLTGRGPMVPTVADYFLRGFVSTRQVSRESECRKSRLYLKDQRRLLKKEKW